MPKRTRSESGEDQDEYKPRIQRRSTVNTQNTPSVTASSPKLSASKYRKNKRDDCKVTPLSADSNLREGLLSSVPHPKSIHIVSSPSPIRRALLKWYGAVHASRGMPWRKPYDPHLDQEGRAQRAYEVWVSEVMLQQTQVATVIPYYNAWMNRFPTIRHLADSSLDEVNALWKGLGYYSRASRLLAGAQKVVKVYHGRLPDNAKELEDSIPGIGRYSAGAICSIAYGECVPALDGNVHRLLSRVLALHAPPKSKATLDILWAAAAAIVKLEEVTSNPSRNTTDHPGDINQSLIELGSTVCRPSDPNCSVCPLNPWCGAYNKINQQSLADIEELCTLCEPLPQERSGVTVYPMKAEKKKARAELDIVSVVEWRSVEDRKFLLLRRPDKGLLAGLYEFPATSNVSVPMSNTKASNLAHEQLLDVLEDSVTPYKEIRSRRKRRDALDASGYRIIKITVQSVMIEGGNTPPKIKREVGRQTLNNELSNEICHALWASVTEVESANISTGVGKIWKLVLSMWEKDVHDT